ncbi:phosphate signaling complex protein PhoU [Georgenia sp. SUBG003]|uniref:phosphate signaling complex protein PhoU n=1 Tax=Georgenia sp. SUBG003 TaxID=1497974 RepID=UPI000AD6ED74
MSGSSAASATVSASRPRAPTGGLQLVGDVRREVAPDLLQPARGRAVLREHQHPAVAERGDADLHPQRPGPLERPSREGELGVADAPVAAYAGDHLAHLVVGEGVVADQPEGVRGGAGSLHVVVGLEDHHGLREDRQHGDDVVRAVALVAAAAVPLAFTHEERDDSGSDHEQSHQHDAEDLRELHVLRVGCARRLHRGHPPDDTRRSSWRHRSYTRSGLTTVDGRYPARGGEQNLKEPAVREIFKQEMEQLGEELLTMAQHMSSAIEKATQALETADLTLAEEVIDADRHIDEIERSLDERGVSLLARQQPVATDLRVVVSALRLSATIERMGDLARHVAYVARGRYPEGASTGRMSEILRKMGEQAVKVARQVVELLETRDLDLAEKIEADDDVLDRLHRESFQVVLDDDEQLTRQQLVDAVLLGRYLERFGDHGVSVARRISFLVTGDLQNAVVNTGSLGLKDEETGGRQATRP